MGKHRGMPANGLNRRDSLPIADRAYTGLITYEAKDPETSFPPIKQVRPPDEAPNTVVVLLDDVGFGAPSTFGGPCETPTADRLAEAGSLEQAACRTRRR